MEKKFRGSNVRMFEFPIFSTERMSDEKRKKVKEDYRAQLQGYENSEDKIKKEEEIYNYTKEAIENSEMDSETLEFLQKAQAEMSED